MFVYLLLLFLYLIILDSESTLCSALFLQDEGMLSVPNSESKSHRNSTAGHTPANMGPSLVQSSNSAPERRHRRFSLAPFTLSSHTRKESPDKKDWLERKCSSPGLTSSNPSLSMPQFMKIRRRTMSTSSSQHPVTFAPTARASRTPVVPHPPPPSVTTTTVSPPPQVVVSRPDSKNKKRLTVRPPPSGGGQKIKRFSVSPCEESAISLTSASTSTSTSTTTLWRPPEVKTDTVTTQTTQFYTMIPPEGSGYAPNQDQAAADSWRPPQAHAESETRYTMIPPEGFGSGPPNQDQSSSDSNKNNDLESVVVEKI